MHPPPFHEDDLRPLSALQHLVYCERQCALIHLEQLWVENRFTAEGRILHERADDGSKESRGKLRIARSLTLRSLRLGLSGKADVVEFHRVGVGEAGAALPGVAGRWRPFPVEYKRGRPQTAPRRRDPALRPGPLPGRDARGCGARWCAVLRRPAASFRRSFRRRIAHPHRSHRRPPARDAGCRPHSATG